MNQRRRLSSACSIRIAGLSGGVTLLNGRLQGGHDGAAPRSLTLAQTGDYRLTALTGDGAFATITLHVLSSRP